MLLRRPLSILIVLLALATGGQPATAAPASDAANFISTLANKTLTTLNEKQLSQQDRTARFRALFHDNFDVPTIARFVLGRYWRTASEADKQEFVKLFEEYIVRSYAARFTEYSGETLKVTGTRREGDNSTVVMSQIEHPGGQPPTKVEWTVLKNGNDYRITDVSVEGVSMALTHRQEFASVIQRNGGRVSGLNNVLRQKMNGATTAQQ